MPQWLINFGLKYIMYYLMVSLRNSLKQLSGSQYEQRLKQRSEYYKFIAKVIQVNINF